MGDIGMNKGGLLAWKLCAKSRVVNGVVGLRSCVGLGDCIDTGIYRERRGGGNKYIHNKYMQHGACYANICTIHLPETGNKLRSHLRRGSRQGNRRHGRIHLVFLINFHVESFSIRATVYFLQISGDLNSYLEFLKIGQL